jgi:glyoxylase-like metal-dependent hydrolase (beta-lactamase superfamily II)
MPSLVRSRPIGRFKVHAIEAGTQRLDGGAMFGVVPKPLWERRVTPDDRNRITLCMRCLLVEHDAGLVLIDTGSGNKETAKFHDIYGIENGGANGRTRLEDGVLAAGFALDDVRLVINSHLHFDHAGGNTAVNDAGVVVPSFPRARYVMHAGEYQYATHTNERTAGSYFAPNFGPLVDAGLVEFIDESREIVPGIRYLPTPGHTPHHQSVVIDGGDAVACFLADVVPTRHHIPLPWIMGYDVEPLVTLESKRRLYQRASADGWLLIFEHDADVAWGHVAVDGKGWAFVPDA